MKTIFVLNCGSSSVKFAVVTPEANDTVLSGLAERLGQKEAQITIKYLGKKHQFDIANAGHEKALLHAVEQIQKLLPKDIQIAAVGHRVTHGGEFFTKSCLITDQTLAKIEKCGQLAPLHNPANIIGIKAAMKAYSNLSQVAVFDTSFHQTLPEKAYLYAAPYQYYKDYNFRRYGFHGTSYRYICSVLSDYIQKDQQRKTIIAHLGNGGSVTAILDGKSVDTSMGLTPLEGLVHGTRSGDIDPASIEFLCNKTQLSYQEMTNILWKESGLIGLSGISNDCRTLEEGAEKGNEDCKRALDVYIYRLIKYIASYAGTLNGITSLVFTGGIGENSDYIREKVCENLSYLNITIDSDANKKTIRGHDGNIATSSSIPVLVIPTNEEQMIANDTLDIVFQ